MIKSVILTDVYIVPRTTRDISHCERSNTGKRNFGCRSAVIITYRGTRVIWAAPMNAIWNDINILDRRGEDQAPFQEEFLISLSIVFTLTCGGCG